MKTFLLMFLLIPALAFPQCSIEDIIVFDHGITQAEAVKSSKAIKGFLPSKTSANVLGTWESVEYLKDSILKDTYWFDVANLQCYKLNRCTYTVYFADDKLYKQNIQVEFDSSFFEDYNEISKKLIQLFKLDFAFAKPFTINQPGTETKISEGYTFTDVEGLNEKVDQVKVYTSITYKYNKELKVPTNEIDKYFINIESINLTGTKLDYRGY